MAEDYARHVGALHAGFQAPAEVIAAAVREVTSRPIVAKQRIVHGEANEVYRLDFESGAPLILRIARRAEGKFEKEAWAIGRCRALGVLAPEVLSLQRREVEGEPLEFCFLEMLPGHRLSDSLSLPRETLRGVVRDLGEQLSRLHSIGADDLGEGARFFDNDTDDFLAIEHEFVRLGAEAGLERRALERAFRYYEVTMKRADPLARSLTHNDFRACHVLVHDGRLSGLIDFGEASIDTPVNEFAKWDYWESPALPIDWLREGYADSALFGPDFGELFRALRIANGLWALRWYALTGYAAGVERAAGRLSEYLSAIS